ncbi:MAG: hypothetical protein U9R07_04350, partial [Pseudomonadota bacterium]|nr:hypothetical protein [Pseudomonadota bacterium]
HGSPCHTNDRGGSAATDYTQGRLTMQPGDHTPNYTSLTDVTKTFNRPCARMVFHFQRRTAFSPSWHRWNEMSWFVDFVAI